VVLQTREYHNYFDYNILAAVKPIFAVLEFWVSISSDMVCDAIYSGRNFRDFRGTCYLSTKGSRLQRKVSSGKCYCVFGWIDQMWNFMKSSSSAIRLL
jgi:hypothetical protein